MFRTNEITRKAIDQVLRVAEAKRKLSNGERKRSVRRGIICPFFFRYGKSLQRTPQNSSDADHPTVAPISNPIGRSAQKLPGGRYENGFEQKLKRNYSLLSGRDMDRWEGDSPRVFPPKTEKLLKPENRRRRCAVSISSKKTLVSDSISPRKEERRIRRKTKRMNKTGKATTTKTTRRDLTISEKRRRIHT